jgi:hypothetical protein
VSGQPYRVPSPPKKERKKKPPAALVYLTSDQEKHVAPARAAAQVGILGTVIGVVIAALGLPTIAIVVLLLTAAVAAWRWFRAPDVRGIELRVRDRVLLVAPRGQAPLLRAPLEDVSNVRLDTKSIQKVVEGGSMIPGMRFIDSKVAPELDVARIVIVCGEAPNEVRLTDAYVAHMDAVEWLGKIRTFLRAHGWEPEDERAEPETDAE